MGNKEQDYGVEDRVQEMDEIEYRNLQGKVEVVNHVTELSDGDTEYLHVAVNGSPVRLFLDIFMTGAFTYTLYRS